MTDEPRYVLRELSGYPGGSGGNARPTTDVMVLDTWDCFRVAHAEYSRHNQGKMVLALRRLRCTWECARLNVEHDAWLAEDVAA